MAQEDPLMSIGTFSRASLLSVSTLRSYHEQGLLVPAKVDGESGYRFYRLSQLHDAAVIQRLRSYDLPLKDVHQIVAARDPEVTRSVIEAHEATMQARLEELTSIITNLQEAIELPGLQTPVHRRVEPAHHAFAITGQVNNADYAPFLGSAYTHLWEAVDRCGAQPIGYGSAMYPELIEHENEPVIAYLALAAPAVPDEIALGANVRLITVPEAAVAVATHVGSYDSIADTYRQLGAWVARNETPLEQPVREHYVVSVVPETGELLPDHELRTEIAWPIAAD